MERIDHAHGVITVFLTTMTIATTINQEGNVRGISYKMISVGNPVRGACLVLLTLPEGKHILHTGDLQFHSTNGITIDEYVAEVGRPINSVCA